MYVEKESNARKVPNLEQVKSIFTGHESSGCRCIEDDKLFIWGKLDDNEDVSEFEPIQRFKWEEVENQMFIYTGFLNCNILTVTSRLSKMLNSNGLNNASSYNPVYSEDSGITTGKDDNAIHQNTLQFINLSLNAADQYRNISYRQEGLPKKSAEEERKHRELVYQTKKRYIESLKKEEEKRRKEQEAEKIYKEQQKLQKDEKLAEWNRFIEQELPNFENIVKKMNDENREESRFRRLWIRGIPERVRAKVWARVTGNNNSLTQSLFEIMALRGRQLRNILQDKVTTSTEKERLDYEIETMKTKIEELEQKQTKDVEGEENIPVSTEFSEELKKLKKGYDEQMIDK